MISSLSVDTQSTKALQIEQILQKIKSFISNPNYENLGNARHIRDLLKRVPVSNDY